MTDDIKKSGLMKRDKKTNNDLQSTIHKAEDWATGAPEG